MNIFYVYEHWRTDKNVCFYVGKGTAKRARFLHRKNDSKHHSRIVEKLSGMGMAVEIKYIHGPVSEDEAFRLEKERIFYWRALGSNLVNITDGGDGASGHHLSKETKEKISRAHIGKPKPHLIGKKHSEEHKAKISASLMGRIVSEETRKKISEAQKGKVRPELLGRKFSAETLLKMKSRVFTPEHRQRISDAKKGKSYKTGVYI